MVSGWYNREVSASGPGWSEGGGGGGARNMKYKVAAIGGPLYFMFSFNRDRGGVWPPWPPWIRSWV